MKTGLRVSNSLTNHKDEFVPNEGKQVKWYICGPTVYDSSHLGHARTYLSFDIIRRILEDYFGYDVQVCMNITDIDDKIIMRARKNYLYEEYVKEVTKSGKLPAEEFETLKTAIVAYCAAFEAKKAKLEADIASKARNVKEAGPELTLATEKYEAAKLLVTRVHAEIEKGQIEGEAMHALLKAVKESICDYMDERKGGSLPHELMNHLTKRHSSIYEAEYLADMKALGIKTPDVLTRVTEYVPEVVAMCEKIISNGFAYESQGSVYFDVDAFDRAKNHHYAKLMPLAYGNQALLAEGEGGLSEKATALQRKSPNDFALWKSSKPGEPAWPSPWGLGRPGWHIECSAMAGDVLGDSLDIHAGGCDLKFPHHDNELAQSEAFFDNEQWVNYFLHTGHLHIDNLKMSKSLKNFITIREMLEKSTAKQARILFLLTPWDSSMNFQRVDTMKEAITKERYFSEFFGAVEQALLERAHCSLDWDGAGVKNEHWNSRDVEYSKALISAQNEVHEAMCDNFDTPRVMAALANIVNKANLYLEKNSERKAFLLKKAAVYVTRILKVFGVIDGSQEFGFGYEGSSTTAESRKEIVHPYVSALVDYRKEVRTLAKRAGLKPGEPGLDLLAASDVLRDETMPKLDVKISDDGEIGFKFQPFAEIERERRERLAAESTARLGKLQAQLLKLQKDYDKLTAARPTAKEVVLAKFKVSIENAEDALPENDNEGNPLSKGAKKEIPKLFKSQDTAHQERLAKLEAKPNLESGLEAQIQSLQTDISNIKLQIGA